MVVENTDRCEVPRVGACSADSVVFCADASRIMKRIFKITATAVIGCAAWTAALQLSLPAPARVAVLLVRLLLLPWAAQIARSLASCWSILRNRNT
jgi:hypothetical protein